MVLRELNHGQYGTFIPPTTTIVPFSSSTRAVLLLDRNNQHRHTSSPRHQLSSLHNRRIIPHHPIRMSPLQYTGNPTIIGSSLQVADAVLSNRDIIDGVFLALILSFLGAYLQGRNSSASDIVLWPKDYTSGNSDYSDNNLFDKALVDKIENSNNSSSPNSRDTAASSSNDAQANSHQNDTTKTNDEDDSKRAVVFDGKKWKEMSRPENYILYSTRVKRRLPVSSNNPVGKETDLGSTLRRSSLFKDEADSARTSTTTTNTSSSVSDKSSNKEQRWVLLGLLILFVPIFSVEFFFANSRQFICGGGGVGDYVATVSSIGDVGDALPTSFDDIVATPKVLAPWAKELCSAHFD